MITAFASFCLGYQLFATATGRPGWTRLAHSEAGVPIWVLLGWLLVHLWRGAK